MEPAGNVKRFVRSTPSLRVEVIDQPDEARLPMLRVSCGCSSGFEVTTRDPATAKWSAANHVQGHARAIVDSFLPRPPVVE